MPEGPSKDTSVGSVHKGHRARIVIADDHIMIADACKAVLEPEFHVVGIAPDGSRLLEQVMELRPDVVILDMNMPLTNGLDAATQIKATKRNTKIIYMTISSEPGIVAEAFRRGASGYVLKQGSIVDLRLAVRRAIHGEAYISPLIDKDEVTRLLRSRRPFERTRPSSRQFEVLRLLAEGKTMKQVAHILTIKPGTVAFHKYKMMEKLGVASHSALIEYALTHDFVSRSSK
jgi:DNA-binding NarL/FixJ family response regulator